MLSKEYKEKIKTFWTNDLKREDLNDIETYIKISKETEKNIWEIIYFEEYRILCIPEGVEEIPTKLWELISLNMDEEHLDEKINNLEEKRYIMYLPPESFHETTIENGDFRKIGDSDKEAFNALKKRTTPEDDELSFVEMDHPVIFGCYMDDKLVSVSSNLNWGEHLADIGILTDSEYRKRGIGRGTVNALCGYNIEQGKINQYRCDAENKGSYFTGKAIGFETLALVYRFKI